MRRCLRSAQLRTVRRGVEHLVLNQRTEGVLDVVDPDLGRPPVEVANVASMILRQMINGARHGAGKLSLADDRRQQESDAAAHRRLDPVSQLGELVGQE